MKKISAILVALTFAASASANGPALNFIEGRYYLAGDKNCRFYEIASPTRITCLDSDDRPTGHFRDAMDEAQVAAFQRPSTYQNEQPSEYEQAYKRQQAQELIDSVRQLGQSANNWGQQIQQQSQQYRAPEVQPISPYGNSGNVTYTRVGDALLGSNGVTYRKVGNSIIGSDGTTCQVAGQTMICR